MRHAAGREDESGIDWAGLLVPMGSLAQVRKVGAFPFGFGDSTPSRPWREPLDLLFAQVARAVYAVTPFRLALVGHEVSGETYADDILQGGGVPQERWIGYLMPSADTGALDWCPPTGYDAPYTAGG